jgi:hypothetical protein
MKKVRLCFRGWKTGVMKCAFEERVEVSDAEIESVLPRLAEKHAEMLAAGGMVEVEFLDETDVKQRFFRFGTDPARMVRPIAIDLDDLKKGGN